MTLGWGIFGLGRHVETRVLPAVRGTDTVRIAAVCSRDMGRARAAAAALPGAATYDDYAAMVEDPSVDAVYIVTPNSLHREHAEIAARAGKHVLCEKPLALTVADAEAMAAACRQAGVRLGVGYHLRQHAAHRAARAMVERGEVGLVTLAEARFPVHAPSRGGWWADPAQVGANATNGLAVHALDLLLYLTGERVVEVTALTNGQRPERPLEDMSLGLLRFAGGGFGYVFGGRQVPRGLGDFVVFGEQARLRGVDTVGTSPNGYVEVATDAGTTRLEGDGRDLYRRQFETFGEAVAAGREPLADAEAGLEAVRVVAAWLESATTGRAVAVPRQEHGADSLPG